MKRTIAALAALILCFTALCGCQTTGFSTKRWIENPDGRLEIVGELLETYPLVGMTEQEILDLLGKHDNSSGYFVEENRFVYRLGIETYDIDNTWLLIDFENGVVVDYSLTKD